MKPRSRFRLLYWFPIAIAVVSGVVLDHRATALRLAASDRRCDELSERIQALDASMKKRSAVERLSAEGNEPRRGESVEGSRPRPVCRPRYIGGGRSGNWLYMDIRHADGQICRYYVRRNPTRSEVRSVVRTIADDSRDRMYEFEAYD